MELLSKKPIFWQYFWNFHSEIQYSGNSFGTFISRSNICGTFISRAIFALGFTNPWFKPWKNLMNFPWFGERITSKRSRVQFPERIPPICMWVRAKYPDYCAIYMTWKWNIQIFALSIWDENSIFALLIIMTWNFTKHIILQRSDSVWSTLDDAVYILVSPLDWGHGTTLLVNCQPSEITAGKWKACYFVGHGWLVGPSTCESKGE